MLNNFVYAKKKSLFKNELNNGLVLDETIAFIEDTKEIWTHGTYFDGSTFEPIKITYSKLKTLRDNRKLSEGHLYRITDYVTTTTLTETKSANHPFDIIVFATSVNELSHIARAIQHEGDTYFDGNDLGAWELWYDLDNDKSKYAWADKTNGKGVIYRMIDDKQNDCPYDFKNILFYNTEFTDNTTNDKYYYTFSYVVSGKLYDGTVEKLITTCHSNSMGIYINNNKRWLNKNVFRNISFDSTCEMSITFNDEYYNDGSGQLVPIKHPDLSTQPSILPYKFMGLYVYELLIPVKIGDRVVGCDFMVEHPMILSTGVFGGNSFKNIDIMATKSDALLLNTESELAGYINVKYTDGTASTLIDFGLSPDGTEYIYDPNTETLSLYNSGEITQNSIPQDLPKKNIILSEGITSIGKWTFSSCSSLTSISIPDSVESIGDNAFQDCSGLTSVTIGNSVTSIGKWTFSSCSSLTSISIPDSVESIGDNAFQDCSGLTSVTIGNSVTSIGRSAFSECSGLTSVTIGNSVTSIGDGAFQYCKGLTSIVVEDGNPVYDSRNNCNAIIETATNTLHSGCKTTIIPDSVTSIRDLAFRGCSSLTSISIPDSVTSIGNHAFHQCSSLTSISIPDGVTSIGSYAFFRCSSLTSVTIGNSVTSIGGSAFWGCLALTSVTIGNSVESIGEEVFYNCPGLISITNKAITPPLVYTSTFALTNKSIIVYVPAESVDIYKAAEVWKDFTNIQAI